MYRLYIVLIIFCGLFIDLLFINFSFAYMIYIKAPTLAIIVKCGKNKIVDYWFNGRFIGNLYFMN